MSNFDTEGIQNEGEEEFAGVFIEADATNRWEVLGQPDTNPRWDTLGDTSGRYDFYVNYAAPPLAPFIPPTRPTWDDDDDEHSTDAAEAEVISEAVFPSIWEDTPWEEDPYLDIYGFDDEENSSQNMNESHIVEEDYEDEEEEDLRVHFLGLENLENDYPISLNTVLPDEQHQEISSTEDEGNSHTEQQDVTNEIAHAGIEAPLIEQLEGLEYPILRCMMNQAINENAFSSTSVISSMPSLWTVLFKKTLTLKKAETIPPYDKGEQMIEELIDYTNYLQSMVNKEKQLQENLYLRVRRLTQTAKIPVRRTLGAAGYDIFTDEEVHIMPRQQCLVKTRISLEFSEGYYARIAPRSGSAYKLNFIVNAGVIDSDFRREPEMEFLGVVVGNRKIRLQQHIIKKVIEFDEKTLITLKGLRSFLGILNYARSHIPNLSKILGPLYSKTSPHGDRRFKESDWVIIRQIKSLVQSLPDLELPPNHAYVIIEIDGSMEGWGDVCKWKEKQYDPRNTEKIYAYASGKFSTVKSTIDAEIHACMEALTAMKIHYLDRKEVILRTDCHAIIKFFNKSVNNKPSRVRWINFTDYITGTCVDIKFEHISGTSNELADALSGIHAVSATPRTIEELQGMKWILQPPSSSQIRNPQELRTTTLMDGSIALSFQGYQATKNPIPRRMSNFDTEGIQNEGEEAFAGVFIEADPTNRWEALGQPDTNPRWDTLGEPSGRYDFYVNYAAPPPAPFIPPTRPTWDDDDDEHSTDAAEAKVTSTSEAVFPSIWEDTPWEEDPYLDIYGFDDEENSSQNMNESHIVEEDYEDEEEEDLSVHFLGLENLENDYPISPNTVLPDEQHQVNWDDSSSESENYWQNVVEQVEHMEEQYFATQATERMGELSIQEISSTEDEGNSHTEQQDVTNEIAHAGIEAPLIEQLEGLEYPILRSMMNQAINENAFSSTSAISWYNPPPEPLMGQINYPPAQVNVRTAQQPETAINGKFKPRGYNHQP
ncbi:hypothetical protein ZIOFF_039137 [Zingiber officinale]|uniref:Uncharacterized protein n=1 Tax=Zingiber officinale TaxID=94328 RepID=A0A8J5G401_ZINOF|nr:hypothetical protein ZIOFF_039137 [Zingiber officinale]